MYLQLPKQFYAHVVMSTNKSTPFVRESQRVYVLLTRFTKRKHLHLTSFNPDTLLRDEAGWIEYTAQQRERHAAKLQAAEHGTDPAADTDAIDAASSQTQDVVGRKRKRSSKKRRKSTKPTANDKTNSVLHQLRLLTARADETDRLFATLAISRDHPEYEEEPLPGTDNDDGPDEELDEKMDCTVRAKNCTE